MVGHLGPAQTSARAFLRASQLGETTCTVMPDEGNTFEAIYRLLEATIAVANWRRMYRRIMVVVDDRPVSQHAVRQGIGLARIHDAEIEFFAIMPRLLATLSDPPGVSDVLSPEVEQAAHQAADELLVRLARMAERQGVMGYGSKGREEDGVSGVVAAAVRRRCDLIVAASSGRNAVMRLFVERLIPGLITASPVPLLICKEPRDSQFEAAGDASTAYLHHEAQSEPRARTDRP